MRKLFHSKYTDLVLILFACWLILKPKPLQRYYVRQTLGTTVLWQGWVSADDWCEVACWTGSTLFRTQQVVYCQYKKLPSYREKSFDPYGWVWFTDLRSGDRTLLEPVTR